MKKLLISVGILNIVAFLTLSFGYSHRDTLATSIWNVFHNERLATLVDQNNPKLAFAIGEYYFNHGAYDIKKAALYYAQAIKFDPHYKEAHYQLGRIRFINGQFTAALTAMRTVLTLDPEFKKAYYMYGLINGYTGDLEQAQYGFEEFIKRDDFNWAGYNDLAWIYFKKGDYQKTKEVAEKGLEKASNNPWLNNIYGTALLNLNQKSQAKIAFETALRESEKMTPEDWGRAYPGNNPSIYALGLEETQSVIRHNLSLLEK